MLLSSTSKKALKKYFVLVKIYWNWKLQSLMGKRKSAEISFTFFSHFFQHDFNGLFSSNSKKFHIRVTLMCLEVSQWSVKSLIGNQLAKCCLLFLLLLHQYQCVIRVLYAANLYFSSSFSWSISQTYF